MNDAYFGLFVPVPNNRLSLDYLLRSRRKGNEFSVGGQLR
jgi:hypothetical protein